MSQRCSLSDSTTSGRPASRTLPSPTQVCWCYEHRPRRRDSCGSTGREPKLAGSEMRRSTASLEFRRTARASRWKSVIRLLEPGICGYSIARLGTSVRVTHSPADERVPTWSPDGKTLFYSSDAAGPPDLYRRFLDSGREESVLRAPGIETPTDISPDGREMLFFQTNRAASGDLLRLRLDGSGQVAGVQQSPASESSGRFSPDGRWVAYDSNESGRFEAYIESLDNPGLRWKVSRDGGFNPEWGAGGTELFFVGPGTQLMSLPIRTKPSFQPGTPRPLFLMTLAVLQCPAGRVALSRGRAKSRLDPSHRRHRQLAGLDPTLDAVNPTPLRSVGVTIKIKRTQLSKGPGVDYPLPLPRIRHDTAPPCCPR